MRDISMPAAKCATQNSGVEPRKICQFRLSLPPSGKNCRKTSVGTSEISGLATNKPICWPRESFDSTRMSDGMMR